MKTCAECSDPKQPPVPSLHFTVRLPGCPAVRISVAYSVAATGLHVPFVYLFAIQCSRRPCCWCTHIELSTILPIGFLHLFFANWFPASWRCRLACMFRWRYHEFMMQMVFWRLHGLSGRARPWDEWRGFWLTFGGTDHTIRVRLFPLNTRAQSPTAISAFPGWVSRDNFSTFVNLQELQNYTQNFPPSRRKKGNFARGHASILIFAAGHSSIELLLMDTLKVQNMLLDILKNIIFIFDSKKG